MGAATRAVDEAVAAAQAAMFGPDDASTSAAIGASSAVLVAAEQRLAEDVTRQRNMGATWQEIGDALGTTRQGAQRRFGKTSTNEPRQFASMVERQSRDEASGVIVSHAYNAECGVCDWATLPERKHGAIGVAQDQRDKHNREEHGTSTNTGAGDEEMGTE